MKTIFSLLLTASLLMAWGTAQAQQGNGHKQRIQSQTEMKTFFEGMDLSEDQMTKINAEQERFAKDRGQLRQKNKGQRAANEQNRGEAREQGNSLRQAHLANVQGILNADQYAQFQTKQTEMRDQRSSRAGDCKGKGKSSGQGQGQGQGSGQGQGMNL
jgi:hypothetical protein